MYKIAIVSDVEMETGRGENVRWAYANRAHALKSHAPNDFEVSVYTQDKWRFGRVPRLDLVFFIDYSFAGRARREWGKYRWKQPLVCSFNKDHVTKQQEYRQTVLFSTWVICNNIDRWRMGGVDSNTCAISNGVDTEFWKSSVPIQDRHEVLWCGSSNPKKGKNYQSIIQPLQSRLEARGITCDFRPIDKITPNLNTPSEQRDWYNKGAVAVCASTSEGGGPSYLMEAASCGCAIATTEVGSTPEWANKSNAVICKPDVDSVEAAVIEAIDRKAELSEAMLNSIQGHSYGAPGHRAKWFYQLFRRLIECSRDASARPVRPFTYMNSALEAI